ncbi:uncharacterized protein SAPINGB_P004619 [Magnusiomyces paraingens]|uniref:N-acetyltransferase domain-containing protein n=1 Tax=Magnusiomyces paraingens TaxID=2606893 RepID=A0A5E8BVK3_9ASCO|nr:uncharacterized protein SAPINGB_P004619 [Saprochaete ingens]VVT55483.1 unnamed protein product [Saprochaete ingens]
MPSSSTSSSALTIRKLEYNEIEQAAQTLVESFETDPFVVFCLPDPLSSKHESSNSDQISPTVKTQRDAYIRALFYFMTYQGTAYTIGDDYGCVAVWVPPGSQFVVTTWSLLRSGAWRVLYQIPIRGIRRTFMTSDAGAEAKKRALLPQSSNVTSFDKSSTSTSSTSTNINNNNNNNNNNTPQIKNDYENHWYLAIIGTKKKSQNQGLAKTLIRHFTEKADQAGIKCYLESTSRNNVEYVYKKAGFHVVEEIVLEDDGVTCTIFCMVRNPGAGPQP